MKWKFFRGVSEALVDGFRSSAFLEESEAGLAGFIRRVEECDYPVRDRALLMYAEANHDDYLAYWRGVLGDLASAPSGTTAVETYIMETGRSRDFDDFMAGHSAELSVRMEPCEIQDALVEGRLLPLLEELKKPRMFIYRDFDFKGIEVSRE